MGRNGIRAGLAAAATLLVAACGGGGGGGGPSMTGPPPNPTYTAGTYPAASTFAGYCANPRTGTDPGTGKAYPDQLGSVVWEKFWIRSWINAYYLWYSEAPDFDPNLNSFSISGKSYDTSTAIGYFDADKTPAITSTGSAKDKFHFTYSTAAWEALSNSGASVGYGATWTLIAVVPPRKALVAYTEPAASGYPATSASVNLARGAEIIAVDGVDLINSNDQASINTLNAGLFPSAAGQTHTFTVVDTPGGASRTVTMTSTTVTETPVQNVGLIPGTTVGYLLFNDHIATAEYFLKQAITTLSQANVTDLVLDIRYNGGGYLDIASELAYMVAGSAQTTNKTFDLVAFNDKYPTTDPITGQAITPTPFWSTAQGFDSRVTNGSALPALNLHTVYVLTGGDTCSASEAIINGLRGIGVNVVLIGSQTCGKPYGFYPQDNCGTTYFSIQFKGVNQVGFGDYTDGFVAANTTSTTGTQIPGCSVADDFSHALGSPQEGRVAAALGYIATGTCPVASGVAPPGVLRSEGHIAKPTVLMNRILRHP